MLLKTDRLICQDRLGTNPHKRNSKCDGGESSSSYRWKRGDELCLFGHSGRTDRLLPRYLPPLHFCFRSGQPTPPIANDHPLVASHTPLLFHENGFLSAHRPVLRGGGRGQRNLLLLSQACQKTPFRFNFILCLT